MYACVHIPQASAQEQTRLVTLASFFSPLYEITAPGTVVVPVQPLRKLMGGAESIASEIARRAHEQKLKGNLSIAANPDTAVLAARNLPGVTIISKGGERQALGKLALSALPLDDETITVLAQWGVYTLERFCELPERGIVERLGERGLTILKLARGELDRPLQSPRPATSYEERMELEHPIALLQPLLFLLSRLLNDLCARLDSHSMATTMVRLALELESRARHTRILQLPFPTRDTKALLKLLQLDLESHPPQAAITAFTLTVIPVEPRVVQHELYVPPQPEPERLELALGKIRALVGVENVGSPEVLNTHRRDAWTLRPSPGRSKRAALVADSGENGLRLGFRYFRPPLGARVEMQRGVPSKLFATGIWGQVERASGPWRMSGDWWAQTVWDREEWDVLLNDGALYRIFLSRRWFVEGSYD
ncbi:MAG: hypothetical protein SFV51_18680 [Bryobacteraceae bacterium]|nr:hypothetical protein [Bryobacteraceae bacterium]